MKSMTTELKQQWERRKHLHVMLNDGSKSGVDGGQIAIFDAIEANYEQNAGGTESFELKSKNESGVFSTYLRVKFVLGGHCTMICLKSTFFEKSFEGHPIL
jgi:nitric oxide reductase activation protein